MKKIFALLLAVLMLAAMLTSCEKTGKGPPAEETVPPTEGLLYYWVPQDGTCAASVGAAKDVEHIVIPPDNMGTVVTQIASHGFENATNLVSITMPDTVTRICVCAFWGCTNLKDIKIPESVLYIEGSAFAHCTSLTSIAIPNGVTIIDVDVFGGCSSLESIIIPRDVTSIGGSAFSGCNRLNTVYYGGTASEWDEISIETIGNDFLTNAARYYYSATEPAEVGNWWHYDENGNPVAW